MASFGDITRINTNIQSTNAVNALNKVNKDLSSTQEKLSTGNSVNKAEDNAAAVTISASLSSKIAGMESSLQSADSAREEDFLSESIKSNSAARSTIIDTDFAKAQSENIRQQIMQKTATAAMSQANLTAQDVLGFI